MHIRQAQSDLSKIDRLRLTHHVHILEMNGDSYRLADSKRRSRKAKPPPTEPAKK